MQDSGAVKKETLTLTLAVQGEFITRLAREKCYYDGKFDYAMELLTAGLVTDQLTEKEIRHIALDILDGRAEIVGTYPGGDYRLKYLDEQDSRWNLGKLIEDTVTKNKELEESNNQMARKLAFVSQYLPDYRKRDINDEYKSEWGEVLFSDILIPSPVEYFVKRMTDTKEHKTKDYGWLEPNGTFHEVDWGEHQKWAYEYLEEHAPQYSEKILLYEAGDILTEQFGWVLLHSPGGGIAFPTKGETRRYSSKQKEFLYDYYISRDCKREANEIYQDEE